jgi:DNA-binding SARP family transcriptional activator
MAERLRVYLLGEFRCYRDGELVSSRDWHTRQARQLFKLLLTERGHTVSVRKLLHLLWPEYGDSAYKTLRSAVSTLRTVLEPGRDLQAPARFVPRGRAGYRLIFPADSTIWIDTVEFERLIDEALAGSNSAGGRRLLEEALQLYTGDYLVGDEEESWTRLERERLRERYFAGVSKLAEWQSEVGLYSEVIMLCRKALCFDACREPLYRLMMHCQASLGDTAAALQTFERCRQVLDEHLGADPAPQTMGLHMSILRGEFQGQMNGQKAPGPDSKRSTRQKGIPPLAKAGSHDKSGSYKEPPFVGRKAELHWLMQRLEEVKGGQGTRTIALVGEAGVGKSFLVRLFLGRARAENVLTLAAACQAIEQNLSFAPLVSMLGPWLREVGSKVLHKLPRSALAQVAPLLPEIATRLADLPAVPAVNSEQAYSTLIAALAELFAELCYHRPLVLSLDDLQWADESTLLVINRLASREDLSLLLLISYRPEDLSENRALDGMLRYLSRSARFHTLGLERFSREEVSEYLKLHMANTPGKSIAQETFSGEELYQLTQGNALFLAEAVRTLLEQQAIETVPGGSLSDSVLRSQQIRDVVLARMGRLPQRAIELLETAAVIGHPFSLDLLRPELSGDDYQALEMLLARRFLVEVGHGSEDEMRLAFSHDMVGQIVCATCSSLKLMQLHRQVAENLVRRYSPTTSMHAAEIAFHHRQAGSRYKAQALRYEVEAGDYARHIFSYRQALAHYDAALQWLEQMPDHERSRYAPTMEEWIGRAYHGRVLACEALLDWEEIQESHRHLSTWAAASRNGTLASNSVQRMAVNRSLMGYLSEAAWMGLSFVQNLRDEAGSTQELAHGAQKGLETMIDMAQRWTNLLMLNAPEQAISMPPGHFPPFCPAPAPPIGDWHEMINALGTPQVAFMLTSYGWVLLLQGLNAEAEQCLRVALQAAEETEQTTRWILASMHLSRVYYLWGQYSESETWFERCIKRGQEIPEAAWALTWPLLNQAYCLIHLGRLDEADRILHTLRAQLAQQNDFLSYRYSVQIGLGLLSLARGELDEAEKLLQEALTNQKSLYIEVYVMAEIGLADIARRKGRYDEAYSRLQRMLSFCGQRSLLQCYGSTSLALAGLSLQTGQVAGIMGLLQTVSGLLARAGYTHMQMRCDKLLAKMTVASGDGRK